MKQYLITLLCLFLGVPFTTFGQCSNDVIAPTAQCSNFTAYLNNNTGQVTLTAANIDGGSTDNCGIASLWINNQAQYTFYANNLGSNSVLLTVIDSAGNADSCQATVVVQDTSYPTVYCQNTTVYLDSVGQVVVWASMVATSSDVGGISYVGINGQDSLVFSAADVGANAVVYVAVDNAGNSASCVAVVTVVDSFAINNSIALLHAQELGVQLYPNPANTTLTIEIEKGSLEQVELRSLTGQVLLQQNAAGKNNIQLSVEQFPSGFYLVVVTTPQGQICQKISIQ